MLNRYDALTEEDIILHMPAMDYSEVFMEEASRANPSEVDNSHLLGLKSVAIVITQS